MTKTEAADILGLEVAIYAARNNRPIDRNLVEALYSELHYSTRAVDMRILAAAPNWKTVLRAATRYA